MKKIILQQLSISNFKGITQLNVNFDYNNTLIEGCNGSGKTTIYDSFYWLLFNKNSEGDTKFNVTPLNDKGIPILREDINTSVMGVLKIGDDNFKIERKQIAIFSKKRGSKNEFFSGFNQQFTVNESRVSATEFKALG